jgi:hypothetical protein
MKLILGMDTNSLSPLSLLTHFIRFFFVDFIYFSFYEFPIKLFGVLFSSGQENCEFIREEEEMKNLIISVASFGHYR